MQTAVKEANLKPEEMEGEELNFETFYTQLKAMGNMGPLKSVFGMMGAPDVPKEMVEQGEEKLKKYKVIISSMTKAERKNERLLHDWQKRIARIAKRKRHDQKRMCDQLISEFNKMKKIVRTA